MLLGVQHHALLGNVHKWRPIFLRFLEIPTYLCPMYALNNIYLWAIFLYIPTYPKIGHPLWTFPYCRRHKKTEYVLLDDGLAIKSATTAPFHQFFEITHTGFIKRNRKSLSAKVIFWQTLMVGSKQSIFLFSCHKIRLRKSSKLAIKSTTSPFY